MSALTQWMATHPEVVMALVATVFGSSGVSALLATWLTRRKAHAEAKQIDAQADKTRFETELAAIKALKEQMEWQQGENARLRGEIEALKGQYAALEQEIATLKQDRDTHAEGERRLQLEKEELLDENKRLAETVQQLRKDNTALRSRVKALEKKVAELEAWYSKEHKEKGEGDEL